MLFTEDDLLETRTLFLNAYPGSIRPEADPVTRISDELEAAIESARTLLTQISTYTTQVTSRIEALRTASTDSEVTQIEQTVPTVDQLSPHS